MPNLLFNDVFYKDAIHDFMFNFLYISLLFSAFTKSLETIQNQMKG